MTGELSAILDHIEKISELDLDGVPPTTHVVEVPNALRARRAAPVLPREVALAQRARGRRRRLLRPEPDRHERHRRAHRRAGGGRRREGRPRRRRAVRGLPRARRGRRPQRVRLGRREDAPAARTAPAAGPLGGVPLGVKDLFCTEGVPSQAGSRILEGYRPPYTATVVRKLAEAGAPLLGKTNQDEFAMGSSNENSAFGPVLNPWDRDARPGRLERRQRRRRRRRHSRRGRSAPTPAARSASPPRCAGSSASSRPTARAAATG